MTKLKIVTDSSCTMEKELRDALGIHVVPLSVMIDGVLYTDDDRLSGEQFMQMMYQAKDLPKTSQPPIGEFAEIYDELGADGSQILSIHMTKVLSGTVEAARQASHLSKSDVIVMDSDFTDQGLSFQVIKAAEMAQAGATREEVIAEVEKIRHNSKLYIGVAKLDNLAKGGRISRATGVISNMLNIHLVMELKDAQLKTLAKGRGRKTFTKWFEGVKAELEKLPNVKQIGISHADGLEIAEWYRDQLQGLFPEMHIPVLQTNPIIATHTGKGAFAIMYYTE